MDSVISVPSCRFSENLIQRKSRLSEISCFQLDELLSAFSPSTHDIDMNVPYVDDQSLSNGGAQSGLCSYVILNESRILHHAV